ncbi:MAG: hypothetical protein GY797_33525 [Deltaproteobacteria bacterium]|nr:hypothetical protein [Deltaproteobacteria bacterium]
MKLKPCPFCGSDPLFCRIWDEYSITCENDDCLAEVIVISKNKQKAVSFWNKRSEG